MQLFKDTRCRSSLFGCRSYFPIYTTLATTEHDLGSRAQSHYGREHDRGQSYVIVGDRARSYDDRTGAEVMF